MSRRIARKTATQPRGIEFRAGEFGRRGQVSTFGQLLRHMVWSLLYQPPGNPIDTDGRVARVRSRPRKTKGSSMVQIRLVVTFLSLVILATAVPQQARSGHTERQTAEGIAVLLVLSAIEKAAAASANADRSDDNYSYNHGLGARENAIAACVHRASGQRFTDALPPHRHGSRRL